MTSSKFWRLKKKPQDVVSNSDKFHTVILRRKGIQGPYKLITEKNEIKATGIMKLVGIGIDNQLKFNEHISMLSSKAATQLNVFNRLRKHMR